MRNTPEKDRQSQVLCVFALVRVLSCGWQSIPEIRDSLARKGFPRCHRTIRRLFKTISGAGIDLLVTSGETPVRYKVRRTRPFAYKVGDDRPIATESRIPKRGSSLKNRKVRALPKFGRGSNYDCTRHSS
jgi:hypothetical protein